MIQWIINFFKALFSRKLTLPHPEESKDPTRTMSNVSIVSIRNDWLNNWGVLKEYYEFWSTEVTMQLKEGLKSPAETSGMVISFDPQWTNPGVMAHEAAHVSWSYLTDEQKAAFRKSWMLYAEDPYMALLFEIKNYPAALWGDPDVEMHAEVWRFLGTRMPVDLIQFYPKLIAESKVLVEAGQESG